MVIPMTVLRFIILLCACAGRSIAFSKPSFESDLLPITVGDDTLKIPHNLRVYPVKVDVQVITSKNGVEYFFTAFGAAQRDDDQKITYGGIVYIYNTMEVKIFIPKQTTTFDTGIAYSGSNTHYAGVETLFFTSGNVRVRAWTACDLPPPAFHGAVAMNELTNVMLPVHNSTFKELNHHLSKMPDLVTVRVLLDSGYMSDGQGALFNSFPKKISSCLSGLLYAYDNTLVRIWIPQRNDSYNTCVGIICCVFEGWSSQSKKKDGTIHIMMWLLSSSEHQFTDHIQSVATTEMVDILQMSQTGLSNVLVNVEVEIETDDLRIMRFQCAGSAMTNRDDKYGNIIYVYTNNSVMFWVPMANGHIVYVGDVWGDGQHNFSSSTGRIITRIHYFGNYKRINCGNGVCQPLSSSTNNTAISCDCSRTRYIGNHCEIPSCGSPPEVVNTVVYFNNVTNGSIAVYNCVNGFSTTLRDNYKICKYPNWTGQGIICIEDCGVPPSFENTTIFYSGVTNGSISIYQCQPGYIKDSGDFIHRCDTPHWIGKTPVCYELKINDILCGPPPNYPNTLYLYNGLTNGSIAEYRCLSGYFVSSGDVVHKCLARSWIGQQLHCIDSFSNEKINNLTDEIKQTLQLDKTTTSSYKRQRISAEDNRPSSKGLGAVAIVILLVIVSAVLLVDFLSLVLHRTRD